MVSLLAACLLLARPCSSLPIRSLARSLRSSGFLMRMQLSTSATAPSDDQLSNLFETVIDKSPLLAHVDVVGKRKLFDSMHKPLFSFIIENLSQSNHTRPLFVGLSAPQGCGKTTVTELLTQMLTSIGISTISLSLDDFYLTGQAQDDLSTRYSGNSLLKYRGNAGTHDLPLLTHTLHKFQALYKGDCESMHVPRYNKSLRQGRGDRSPIDQWTSINSPVQVILLEGWMLGFQSLSPSQLKTHEINPEIVQINKFLYEYQSLHYIFDCWMVLAVQDVSIVFQWRLQAEQQMRALGKPSLSDAQVQDFVQRFMPAYRCYLPELYEHGPERRNEVSVLKVTVDEKRFPVHVEAINNGTGDHSKPLLSKL